MEQSVGMDKVTNTENAQESGTIDQICEFAKGKSFPGKIMSKIEARQHSFLFHE